MDWDGLAQLIRFGTYKTTFQTLRTNGSRCPSIESK
jgi:hypothetical protein